MAHHAPRHQAIRAVLSSGPATRVGVFPETRFPGAAAEADRAAEEDAVMRDELLKSAQLAAGVASLFLVLLPAGFAVAEEAFTTPEAICHDACGQTVDCSTGCGAVECWDGVGYVNCPEWISRP